MFMHTQLSIISGTIRCSQEIVGFRFLLRESFQSNLFEGEKLQVVRHLVGTDRTVLLTSYFDACVEDVSTPLFSACRTLNEIILIVRENGRDVYSMYIR